MKTVTVDIDEDEMLIAVQNPKCARDERTEVLFDDLMTHFDDPDLEYYCRLVYPCDH